MFQSQYEQQQRVQILFWNTFTQICKEIRQREDNYVQLLRLELEKPAEGDKILQGLESYINQHFSKCRTFISSYSHASSLSCKSSLNHVYIRLLQIYELQKDKLKYEKLDSTLLQRQKYLMIQSMNGLVYAGQYLVVRFLQKVLAMSEQRLKLAIKRGYEIYFKKTIQKPVQAKSLSPVKAAPIQPTSTQAASKIIKAHRASRQTVRTFQRVSRFNKLAIVQLLGIEDWYYLYGFDFYKTREENCIQLFEHLQSKNKHIRKCISSYSLARAQQKEQQAELQQPQVQFSPVRAMAMTLQVRNISFQPFISSNKISFKQKKDILSLQNIQFLTTRKKRNSSQTKMSGKSKGKTSKKKITFEVLSRLGALKKSPLKPREASQPRFSITRQIRVRK